MGSIDNYFNGRKLQPVWKRSLKILETRIYIFFPTPFCKIQNYWNFMYKLLCDCVGVLKVILNLPEIKKGFVNPMHSHGFTIKENVLNLSPSEANVH